jgi:hypothetical protein
MVAPVMAAAIAAPVIGGIMGGISSSKSRKQAAAAAAAAYAELSKVGLPPDLSREVILQKFQEMGILTPELEQDFDLQASQVAQIQEDPQLRNAQLEALSTLGQVSRGGLRAEDRAAYNELRNRVQQDAEAKRQQLLQSMQAKGMGGSGAELMAQLQSSQASADTASAGADNLAAEASRRALEAISQRANLAGSVRGQDLSAEEMKARAIDDRNRFLYENSVARQRGNVNRLNEAQAANLGNKQNIANMNVGQGNTESLRQNQAKRDYWQDQLGLASAKANALNNQGSVLAQNSQQQANMYSNLGNALGQGFAAYGSYANKASPAVPNNNQRSDDELLRSWKEIK